jgi:hypothetical protein
MRLSLLFVVLLLSAGVAGGTLWTALREAERGLVAALEVKAKSHARIVRSDIELALRLGIPLDELPGAYDYLEDGAQADPDIRFVAITGASLDRLHYGGIGRARLDPLLDTVPVRSLAESLTGHPDQPLLAVAIDGFSIIPAPLFDDDRHAGFVVVAVQGKQIQEALIERLGGLVPAALAIFILILELVVWTAASTVEEPWRRLRRMMARLADGRQLLWSVRHDRSELGRTMRLVNGILYRLKDRAERVAVRASEAERAVFDPAIASAVRDHTAALNESPLAPLLGSPEERADRRASDVHAPVVLFAAAVALGLGAGAVPYLSPALELSPLALWLPMAVGAGAGLLLGLLLRRPGWLLVLAGLGIASVAVTGTALPLAGQAVLATALLLTLVAGWLHLAGGEDVRPHGWLLAHVVAGIAAGGLLAVTLIHEDRLVIVPWLQLGLVGLAVLASSSEPLVRRQLFAHRSQGSAGLI